MAGDNRIQITISADASSAKGAVADLRRQLDGLGGGAGDAGRAMEGFSGSLGSVKGMLAGLGVLAVAKEFKDLGVAVFETGRQMETLELSFKAITGSAAGARAELAATKQLARDYGQDFLSMAQSSKTFLAAAKDTELAGTQSREVIKGVSAAVAALGLSSQDAQGVFLALGQMMSKGTVQAEELRGQLGERLPGAFGIAAKAMGVSTAELGKMMEQGQVLATDLVPKMAKALEQEYGQAAKEAGNTGTAAVNQLSSAWTDFKSSLADTGAFEYAKKMMRGLADVATETARKIREANGSYEGGDRAQWLTRRIQMLELGLSGYQEGMDKASRGEGEIPGYLDVGAWRKAIDEARRERSLLQSDILDAQRSDSTRVKGTVSERERAKADSLTKASQQATMESWAKSADPGTAAWAKFELARSKSWKEVNSGKIDHGAFEQEMAVHQGVFDEAQKKAAKKDAASATAGAKADIRGSGVLQRVEDEISAVEESLGGNRLGASIAKIERDHNRALSQIRADLVGAKGGVEELHAAEERMGELKALKIKQAQVKAYYQELDFWANNLIRTGELKNDPVMAYAGKLTKLQADLGREIEDITGTAASKAQASWDAAMKASQESGADTTAIWQGVADDWNRIDQERVEKTRLIEERAQLERTDLYYKSLGDAATLDQGYFDHKRKLLDNEVLALRGVITNETALRTYASRKYSELARQELEARMDAQDSFLGYLGDYLSLEFGLYKDHTTRTREMWRDMAASSAGFLRQIGQELQTGLSDYLGALLNNDSTKREKAWRDMLQRMLSDAARWAIDMAMMMAKNVVFMPIVGQFLGVEGMEGLSASVQGGTQGKSSSGLSLSKLGQYGGTAKDLYSMSGGTSGIINSVDKWGMSSLGVGSMSTGGQEMVSVFMEAGMTKEAATSAAMNYGGMQAGTGLGSMLSAGAMGAGVGWMAGQFLAPKGNTTPSSAVGGATGLGAGMLASYLGAGSWAGPIGIAAGLVASAITAAITPATKTSTWGVPKASQPAVWVVDGKDVAASYGVIKTTTSGFGGSQSTSHATIYDLASSEISAEVKAGMDAAGASLKSFSKSLGQTDADFSATMKGVQSMMIAIPEGMEDVVYKNLTNLKTEHYLKQMGLIDQANGLLRAGESYIDLINRTETAAATAGAALGVVGLSLEQMSGSAERLIQGDWASKVIEVMGGADAFTGAMTRFNNWAYSGAEQAAHATEYFGGKAIEALGEIQASGVTLTNFWGEYRTRMEAGMMSPEEFGQWARAATWVEQAYNSAAAAAEQQVQAEQTRLQAMQATRQELAQQVDAWADAKQSLRDFLHSMRTDQYTTLSPTANLAERQARYNEARDAAKSGDLGAQDDFRQYAQDFREFSYDFYGANQDYVAIDQMIQADTAGLISAADMQLAATNEQIARLDADILVSQQILASSSLVNDNLARVAGAVESSGSSIVGAINSLGANASFDGGGQSAAINFANDQLASMLAMMGGSSTPVNPLIGTGILGFAEGGLVTGGIPGVDSVPALLMPGERVFNVAHSRIIERLASSSSSVDTAKLERLLSLLLNSVSSGNAAVAKLLAKVEANTATVASEMERA